MTRVLHRPRADEALIPVATSRPAPIAPSAPLPAKRAHAAEVLRELRAADTSWAALGMRQPVAPKPIPLIDWSARIAADWQGVEARLDKLHRRIPAEQAGLARSLATAVTMLTQPLFADLADFAAELDDDRCALYGHVNAERVLIAELAPLADAVKAGC